MITSVAVQAYLARIAELFKEQGFDESMSVIYDAEEAQTEEWISDKEAVNKKNTKLLPLSGKFRRKTIDRKDFLFNKFESLLNEH